MSTTGNKLDWLNKELKEHSRPSGAPVALEPKREIPKYAQLRVKQVRMSDEMIDDLYRIARLAQDQRTERTEVFTASTIARVCINFCLKRWDPRRVSGNTEEELLESLEQFLGLE